MRFSNWYSIVKTAVHGQGAAPINRLDQKLPSWNPYAPRRKSPNDMADTKNKAGDGSAEGPNDGSMNGRGYDAAFEDFERDTLLDQYDDGSIANSPSTQDSPLDAIYDPPMNNGDGPHEWGLSPLGENKTVGRMARSKTRSIPTKTTTPEDFREVGWSNDQRLLSELDDLCQ